MNTFNINRFVAELRSASGLPAAKALVYQQMLQAFQEPDSLASAIPDYPDDDTLWFEDETITIWHCRFPVNLLVPPHDHQITAMIGVYEGGEENRFYLPENGQLVHKATKQINKGEVAVLDPDTIHSVNTLGNQPSCAIHVYLGALTQTKRHLFDWDTGEARLFTDEAYYQAVRFR